MGRLLQDLFRWFKAADEQGYDALEDVVETRFLKETKHVNDGEFNLLCSTCFEGY